MKTYRYFFLFALLCIFLAQTEGRENDRLYLRGVVFPSANMTDNRDGVFVDNNDRSAFFIKLMKKNGRSPASTYEEGMFYMTRKELLNEGIETIVVEAP